MVTMSLAKARSIATLAGHEDDEIADVASAILTALRFALRLKETEYDKSRRNDS